MLFSPGIVNGVMGYKTVVYGFLRLLSSIYSYQSLNDVKEFAPTLFTAFQLLSQAWLSIEKETITKCFRHCGFIYSSPNDASCSSHNGASPSSLVIVKSTISLRDSRDFKICMIDSTLLIIGQSMVPPKYVRLPQKRISLRVLWLWILLLKKTTMILLR